MRKLAVALALTATRLVAVVFAGAAADGRRL